VTLRTRNILLILSAAALIAVVAIFLRAVFIPLMIAFFISYAFEPFIVRISAKTGRALAIIGIMLIVAIVVAVLLLFLIPMLIDLVHTFLISAPSIIDRIAGLLSPFLRDNFGIEFPDKLPKFNDWMKGKLHPSEESLADAGTVVQHAFRGTMGVISLVVGVILIPFFSYYFMRDYSKIVGWFERLIPPRYRSGIGALMSDIDDVLSQFIRGQLLVCLVMSVLYGTALTIIGVPKGAGIGILTGILNIVPYVGLFTGFILSVSSSMLHFDGWMPVFGSVITFSILPMVDNFFVTPRILGRSVGMNPVIIVIALLTGASLFGIMGLLIAVPTAAVIRVIGTSALEAYFKSDVYTSNEKS